MLALKSEHSKQALGKGYEQNLSSNPDPPI